MLCLDHLNSKTKKPEIIKSSTNNTEIKTNKDTIIAIRKTKFNCTTIKKFNRTPKKRSIPFKIRCFLTNPIISNNVAFPLLFKD